MPAICRWAPSVMRVEGLGGLPRTGIRGALLSVAMRSASQGVGCVVGGCPSSLVCVLHVRCGNGPDILTGQRRFVWWRQAVEHSFNGPAGGYPSPFAKPAL